MDTMIGGIHRNGLRRTHENAVTQVACRKLSGNTLNRRKFQQFPAEFPLQLFRLFMLWQQRNGFDIYQPGRHLQKTAGDLQISHLHLVNIRKVLFQKAGNLNIHNVEFMFGDQVKQKVERAFKNLQFKTELFQMRSPTL